VLQDLDPTDLNTRLRSWLCTRTGTVEGRTVIAVDGKTVRGARLGQASAPHLLSALDHATGAVLTQARVVDKSNEIPVIRELLEPFDLDGVVVTADAMHTQVDTAQWIRDQGGHYVLHRQRQPEDSAQDVQGPALEEGPVRLECRHRPRAAGAAHRPRLSRHPSGWTSP